MDADKPVKVNREKVVVFRATQDEKQQIEANAARAGLDTSEFLRRLGLETKLAPALAPEERRLLVGIANNLNQVARRANANEEQEQWLPELAALLTRLDAYFI